MTRIERLHEIVAELRRRRLPITAAALGELFSVSERTVYRDVQTLRELGTRIAGASGFGYVLEDAEGFATIARGAVVDCVLQAAPVAGCARARNSYQVAILLPLARRPPTEKARDDLIAELEPQQCESGDCFEDACPVPRP